MNFPDLPRMTVLSVFTGTGGLDCGLEVAGLETVGCIELDHLCRRSIEENRPNWKLLDSADVLVAAKTLRPADVGLARRELDVLAGGPPCQPFSVAGQWTSSGRRGMDDDRARTVAAMLDLVEVFLPRTVVIENVAGFLRGKISALPFVENRLDEINELHGTAYRLHAQIVDAADYGVPQHRRRVIAVATREGVPFALPKPTFAEHPITAWDAIGDLKEATVPACKGGWTDLLPSIPEGGNYQYLTARGGGSELFGYRTRYWSFLLKLAKDKPSWTLPASPGPSTGPFHWANRPLSARERMRLQSFPDDWQPVGSYGEQVKQIGNATPPLLGEVIGRALVSQVLAPGVTYPRDATLLRPRLGAIPAAVPPAPIPPRFELMVGQKTAHLGTGKGPAPRQAVVS
ncbi:DNA cytosine methyltransferase [Micromonospora sp. NBC_00898]|uniref:DNA cytosine methyltransferase n=1 Tax=Micromonospora sp. NBC_00898 TaxID=2975981 RepID=UPI00386A7D97|nr:DNA cytosine methyltransferase [Micromonospora sp. NBC_00898]